jgi:hypothetical protein
MLKWIGGGCLVIALIVGVLLYASFKKMSEIADKGPVATVMIGASPNRVFASLANTDSFSTWQLAAPERTSRKGMLMSGDTIFMATRDSQPRGVWIVDTLIANQLIALRMVSLENGKALFRRRDSLSAVGDSTLVTSTAVMMAMDSLVAANGRPGGVTGGIMDFSVRMGTAGMRMQAEQELGRLKRRIEGTPAARPDSA